MDNFIVNKPRSTAQQERWEEETSLQGIAMKYLASSHWSGKTIHLNDFCLSSGLETQSPGKGKRPVRSRREEKSVLSIKQRQ